MILFTVEGRPAPQGSKAYKGHRAGKPVLVEQCKSVKPWRAAVKAAAQVAMIGKPMMVGPIKLTIVFVVPRPKWVPKARKGWPCVYPDSSKLLRATEDAMTDAGVWGDDAQVCVTEATKRYQTEGEATGAHISVSSIQ